ncbi:hypothetical protein [Paenibacillus donghaensis]|uniref:Uncharacterized protein n=1 Tax=Paenibacillus donghaensis TaxID=414771 RepID=A0A2Z2KMN9_9BACL|nr:hypothetical protein [Paenibacillus donghaensis]ASA24790.1 hypothetical protein B9T62_30950 [Paenibacillus donghaensis]
MLKRNSWQGRSSLILPSGWLAYSTSPDVHPWFKPDTMHIAKFINQQVFDYDGLCGRLRSSSYTPARML